MKKFIPNLSFLLLIFLFTSCEEVEDNIPDVHVSFSIYLDDPVNRELRTVGNSITVVGGHAGIIIYRLTNEEFIAYDRICPVEIKSSCRLDPTNDDLFYRCECCNTPYLIIDGTGQSKEDSTFAGTGKLLKGYRTSFDNRNQLLITNY